MAKFWIGLLIGILITMLFYEQFPGGPPEAYSQAKTVIRNDTP